MAFISSWTGGGPYVFSRSSAGWEFAEKLVPSVYALGTGEEVGIDRDTVFFGAAAGGAFGQGLVFVFDRAGGTFTEQQLIVGPSELLEKNFGMRIGLSGNDALILNSARLVEFVRPGSAGAGGTGAGAGDAGELDAGAGGNSSAGSGALDGGGSTDATSRASGASEDAGCGCRVPRGGSQPAFPLVLLCVAHLRHVLRDTRCGRRCRPTVKKI